MNKRKWAAEWRAMWEVIARVERAGGTSIACLLCEHAKATGDLAAVESSRAADIAEAIYLTYARRWLALAREQLDTADGRDWLYRVSNYRLSDIVTMDAPKARAIVQLTRQLLSAQAQQMREEHDRRVEEKTRCERAAAEGIAQLDAELRQAASHGWGTGAAERAALAEEAQRVAWELARARAAAEDVGATTLAQITAVA